MNTLNFRRQAVRFSTWIIIVCLAALTLGSVSAAPATGFQTSGRYLLDANGNNFVMRGINHPHAWYPTQTSSFVKIKATGANTIRVVLSSGKLWPKSTASDVANVIHLCRVNKLVCVLEVHDTTGYGEKVGAASLAQAVRYWKEIKSVLDGQEAYVILNLGNEPYGNNNTTNWVTDTKNAIIKMRNAGFQHTLMVDAPNWGQDSEFRMRDNAAGILASDSMGNTIFSIHMFGVFDTADKIRDYLLAYVNAGLPVVIGEFGHLHTSGDPDEDAIMSFAEAYGIGYLGWSWSGNNADVNFLNMVKKFNPTPLTSWGDRIINGENGIRRTSCRASIYDGRQDPKVCSITRIDADPTKAQTVEFSVKFSAAVMDVEASDFTFTSAGITGAAVTGVTGYNDSYYNIIVDTGSGNGTLRLDIPAGATITAIAGNPLQNLPFITGEAYTMRKPPTLLSPANSEVLLHRRPVFDWADFPSAAKYGIQVSRNSTFDVLDVNGTTLTSTYTPTADLGANKTYYWRVRVQVGGLWSFWSEPWWNFTTARPPSITVLSTPTHKAIIRDYTPLLDWNDSTVPTGGAAFDHYQVQVDTDKTFADPILIDEVTSDSSFTPAADLAAKTKHFWRVCAFNVAGEYSSWSTVYSFTTTLLPPGNLTPTGGEFVGMRKPVLDWDAVEGASGYIVQISTSDSFATLLVNTAITADTFTPSTNLPANTLLYWRVRSTGTNGPSGWSIAASFHTP